MVTPSAPGRGNSPRRAAAAGRREGGGINSNEGGSGGNWCTTKNVLICMAVPTLFVSLFTSLSSLHVLTEKNHHAASHQDDVTEQHSGMPHDLADWSLSASGGKKKRRRRRTAVASDDPMWWLVKDEDDWYDRVYDFDNTNFASLPKLHALRNLSVRNFFNPVCGRYRFNITGMPDVSVIVTVQNEQPRLLSITIHSLLARTPPELLREIIIVDDNGVPPNIRGDGVNETEFEEALSLSPKVRLVRNHDREGCARSRLLGAKAATGTVLMFVDSHIEMTSSTWAQHLLIPIMENPHTMSLQTIDVISDLGEHDYGKDPGGLLWGTVSEGFLFDYQGSRFKPARFAEHPTKRIPYETPFGPGSLFAIRRDEFFRLGGYDEGLYVWGGENTELAFKIWMCGGRMVMVPCSRTGHMYRVNIKKTGRWPPYIPQSLTDRLGLGMDADWKAGGHRNDNFSKIVKRNNIRVMSIWVGDDPARDAFYEMTFKNKTLPPEWKQFEDELMTDPAAQKQIRLRKRNKCKNFEWFDRHVFFKLLGKHHPWHPSHPRQVMCGAHKADSCGLCPQGNGKLWCNGDCHWCEGLGTEELSCVNDTIACPDPNKIPAKVEKSKGESKGEIKSKGEDVEQGPVQGKEKSIPNKVKEGNEKAEAAPVPKDKEEKDSKGGVAGESSGTNLTLSVILPCGFEHEYFRRTALSVFETTPSDVLAEIIIVDDASEPPLEPLFPDAPKYKVKFVRSDEALGLIGAKHVGAAASRGDVLVFFDCHVKPSPDYWKPFVQAVEENYRRVVVPTITSLNVEKWEEFNRPATGSGGGMSKCYLTFDGEFKWTTDSTSYVPVMSGGLLAMSRRWFFEVGGYDMEMKGWGGENLDQSLRIWRCGGEIVAAPDSYVAHMWRDEKHPKKYKVAPGDAPKNRARAMKAHGGPWFEKKTLTFPAFSHFQKDGGYSLDASSITDALSNLKCETFEWYLWRFKHIYRDAGVLPYQVFQVESLAKKTEDEDAGPLCLQLKGHNWWNNAGAPDDEVTVSPCVKTADPSQLTSGTQWWHLSGRDKKEHCCSGLRVWNTDQCLQNGIKTGVCDLNDVMRAHLTSDGLLRVRGDCLSLDPENNAVVALKDCAKATKWKQRDVFESPEYRLLNSTMKKVWKE